MYNFYIKQTHSRYLLKNVEHQMYSRGNEAEHRYIMLLFNTVLY